MNFRSTCVSQAVSALLGGLALLAVPGQLLALFGLQSDEASLIGRLAGGMMIALGGTLWASRVVADVGLRRQIVAANATCDALMVVVFAVAGAWGPANPLAYVLAWLFAINCGSWLWALRAK